MERPDANQFRTYLRDIGVYPPTNGSPVTEEDLQQWNRDDRVHQQFERVHAAWDHGGSLAPCLFILVGQQENAEEEINLQFELYRPLLAAATVPILPLLWYFVGHTVEEGVYVLGHASLLRLDHVRRTHTFFEPGIEYLDGLPGSFNALMEHRVLLPGYRSEVVRWGGGGGGTLQGAWDLHDDDPPARGAQCPRWCCSRLTLLVLACCYRFHWLDPGAVGRVLRGLADTLRETGDTARHDALRIGLARWQGALWHDLDDTRVLRPTTTPVPRAPSTRRPMPPPPPPMYWFKGGRALRRLRCVVGTALGLGRRQAGRRGDVLLPAQRHGAPCLVVLMGPDVALTHHIRGDADGVPVIPHPGTDWLGNLQRRAADAGYSGLWIEVGGTDQDTAWCHAAAGLRRPAAAAPPLVDDLATILVCGDRPFGLLLRSSDRDVGRDMHRRMLQAWHPWLKRKRFLGGLRVIDVECRMRIDSASFLAFVARMLRAAPLLREARIHVHVGPGSVPSDLLDALQRSVRPRAGCTYDIAVLLNTEPSAHTGQTSTDDVVGDLVRWHPRVVTTRDTTVLREETFVARKRKQNQMLL